MGCDCGCDSCCEPKPLTEAETKAYMKAKLDEIESRNYMMCALDHAKRFGHYPASSGNDPFRCIKCGNDYRERP